MRPFDPVLPSSLSSHQFCLAMEHAAVGTALVSLDGLCVYANAALCRLFGYNQHELTSLSIADLTHPEDLETDLSQLANLRAGAIPSYQMEKRYIRKDGATVWAELSVALVRREDGVPEYYIAQAQDITARRLADAERARLTERITLATEAAQVGIWEWEFESGRVDWNAKMRALYDVEPGAPLSFENFQMRVHPEDLHRVQEAIEGARRGAPYNVEFRVLSPSGQVRRMNAQAVVLAGADGRPERMIGTNIDITELRTLAEQAEIASEAKSQFLATMSHEIRTPLNGILGIAGALARTALTDSQREMVSIVETSAVSLESLLSDVLDLARVEAGKVELNSAPFDLNSVVRACAALFDAAADAKGLALQLEIAPGALGSYIGDAARIRQILSNLLGNAIKFTAEGRVTLRVTAENRPAARRLVFEVRDTGIGFDEMTTERLFSPFEQADGSITRKFGGSGLGLAISRALARAMGGELDGHAKPGEGALFRLSLELPVCAERTASESGSPHPDAEGLDLIGLRVLLAEDHPVNQRVVEMILGAAGVDLACVQNGSEAVEACRHRRFDAVLMDMQMPVMDGLTAVRQIRAWELSSQAERLPILMLTANAMPEHVRTSRDAGADGHIAKPIVASSLLKALAEVARGQQLDPSRHAPANPLTG